MRSIHSSKDATAKAYRLRTRFNDGGSGEEWIVTGSHGAERAGKRGLYIVRNEFSMARELSRTDSPELAWVEMSYYRGLKSYKGKPTFLFSIPFDNKRLSGDHAQIMAITANLEIGTAASRVTWNWRACRGSVRGWRGGPGRAGLLLRRGRGRRRDW